MKLLKQIGVVLLCFLMVSTSFFTVHADQAWAEGNEGDFVGVNGWTAFGHGEHIYVDGDDAFCINNHEDFIGGETVAMDPNDLGLSHDDARFLSLIQYYAQKEYGWGMAQNCIWLYIHGSSGVHFYIETDGASSFDECRDTYQHIYSKAWNYMYERPSFEGEEVEIVIGESVTLSDANHVLSDYNVSPSDSCVDVSISGNSLILRGLSPSDDFVSLKFTHKVSSKLSGANIVWQLSGQNVGCFRYADPAEFSIKVKVIGGIAVIEKVDEFDRPAGSGTVFELYRAIEDEEGTALGSNGLHYSPGELLKTASSDENGIIRIGADEGSYFIREADTADPYVISEEKTSMKTWFPILNEEDGTYGDADMTKEPYSGAYGSMAYIELRLGAKTYVSCANDLRSVSLSVVKIDEEENYRKINDAKFTVYDVSDVLDENGRKSEEIFFLRKGATVSLKDYLFAAYPDIREEINGRPVSFEVFPSSLGTLRYNGSFSALKTGILQVKAKGGSYELYGSDITKELTRGSEFDPYDISFYADENGSEKIVVNSISCSGDLDLSTPGDYTLTYHMESRDGVSYDFDRNIKVKEAIHECVYDAKEDSYIYSDDGTKCEVIGIEETGKEKISKIIVSAFNDDYKGKDLGSFEVIIQDGDELSALDQYSYEGLKLFEGLSGHSYIQISDPYDHDRFLADKEVILYLDSDKERPFRSYTSDDLGMIDLFEDDYIALSEEESEDGIVYFDDGLSMRAVELKRQKEGKLDITHLKHSRDYLVCETALPQGYDYGDENACFLLKTGEYGPSIENKDITLTNLKRRLDVVLYKTDDSLSIRLDGAIFDVYDTFEEGEDRNVIRKEKNVLTTNQSSEYIPLSLGKPSFSEKDETGLSFYSDSFDIDDLIIVDGDGDEYPSSAFIRKHQSDDGQMDNEADVYTRYKADRIERKYLGRYVSGGIYKVYPDSEGAIIEVSSDESFNNIVASKPCDDSGAVIFLGLSDGKYFIRKEGDGEYESVYVSKGMIFLPQIIYGHDLEVVEIKAPEGYFFDESTFILEPKSPYGIDRIENYRRNSLIILPFTGVKE